MLPGIEDRFAAGAFNLFDLHDGEPLEVDVGPAIILIRVHGGTSPVSRIAGTWDCRRSARW